MKKENRVTSQEAGLLIALTLGKYFLGSEHLHYGLWSDGLEVKLSNLPAAQEKYCDLLARLIPAETQSILDVGCGTGLLAKRLMGLGYHVECVSPSPLLSQRARKILGERTRIFLCNYEELETTQRYDLVLFSESFQYVHLKKALAKTCDCLKPGGHLLICDFFKTDAPGKTIMGGGHRFSHFRETISRYPFRLIQDLDLTPQTSPNLTLVNDFLTQVGLPLRDLLFQVLDQNHPLLYRFIKWKFKKRLNQVNEKYFSGQRNAQNFEKFKSYRCLLYQKVNGEG